MSVKIEEVREASTVLKPTATVHIGGELGVVARKLFNVLLLDAQSGGHIPNQRRAIRLCDVRRYIGRADSHETGDIKAALETLTTTKVEWNVLGQDRTHEWGVTTFLAGGRVRNGWLYYWVNPELAEQLLSPRLFAKLNLLVQSQLRRRHALAIYEALIDGCSRDQGEGVMYQQWEIDALRRVLGFGEGAYAQQYKFLKRDILRPVLQELNRHTDLEVAFEEIKSGRRVTAVQFSVARRPEVQLALGLEDGAAGLRDGRTEPAVLLEDLVAFGVNRYRAEKLLVRYSLARVRSNLRGARAALEAGQDVQKPGAYLASAIEGNYYPPRSRGGDRGGGRETVPADDGAAPARLPLGEGGAHADVRQAFEAYRMAVLEDRIARQSQAWLAARRQAFLEALQSGAGSGNITLKMYKREGWSSEVVQARFRRFVEDELLTEAVVRDFETFAAQRPDRDQQAA